MLMSEFTERTGYTPVEDEYAIIEDSYYDFEGDKNEFCEQWLKDKADGHWDREMNLRKKYRQHIREKMELKSELATNVKIINDLNEAACKACDERDSLENQIKEKENELAQAKNEIEFLQATAGAEITYKLKNGEKETKRVEAVKYIDNGIQFINVIEESGWTTSIRISDLETFEIK